LSNAPNEYRLVFMRFDFDEVDMYTRRNQDPEAMKTFTDWRRFTGEVIKVKEAHMVEFRHNKETS